MARDFDFSKMLPYQWIRDGEVADFEGFLADIQSVFDDRLADTDRFTDLISIDDCPDGVTAGIGGTNFMDVMLAHLGNPFPFAFTLTTPEKRRLAELLVPLYRQKGTCVGVENAIRVLTGFDSQCLVLSENFAAWQLNLSLLGESAFLYGNEGDLWTFEVHVNGTMTQTDKDRITEIINYMKPLEAKLAQLIQGAISTNLLRFDMAATITQTQTLRHDQTVAVEKTSLIRTDLEV